jgi:hypothetical protein
MKIKQLIETLQKFDGELEVRLECIFEKQSTVRTVQERNGVVTLMDHYYVADPDRDVMVDAQGNVYEIPWRWEA